MISIITINSSKNIILPFIIYGAAGVTLLYLMAYSIYSKY